MTNAGNTILVVDDEVAIQRTSEGVPDFFRIRRA